MPSGRDIKRRMKSVKNTQQITRAMEAVSATKMRRSQEVALKARPFSYAAMELLGSLSQQVKQSHIFLHTEEEKNICLIMVASDKGLCGSLNSNLLRKVEKFLKEKKQASKTVSVVAVGKYGANFLRRRGADVVLDYKGIGDIARLSDSYPVSDAVLEAFHNKQYDTVYIAYTRFISTLKQAPEILKVLPLDPAVFRYIVNDIIPASGRYSGEKAGTAQETKKTKYQFEYLFEPSPKELVDKLFDALVRAEMHHLILESNASEHSARMVAMKSASENAKELMESLQLTFNKARQASITREISEVTGGAEALKKL
jgi:F-type H+-transporting ATPase subunit gamma